MSIPSGYVDWSSLLKEIANDLKLDVKKEHDLLSLSQYHVNANRGRHRLTELLVLQFDRLARPNINHKLIAELPIRTIWTTNYDTLIEQAFAKNMRRIDKKDDYEDYERTHHQFSAALQGDLVSKTFLFLGLSLKDPNIDYMLGRMRVLLGKHRRDHFYALTFWATRVPQTRPSSKP